MNVKTEKFVPILSAYSDDNMFLERPALFEIAGITSSPFSEARPWIAFDIEVGFEWKDEAEVMSNLREMGNRKPGVLMLIECHDFEHDQQWEVWGMSGAAFADLDHECYTDDLDYAPDKARAKLAAMI